MVWRRVSNLASLFEDPFPWLRMSSYGVGDPASSRHFWRHPFLDRTVAIDQPLLPNFRCGPKRVRSVVTGS